MKAHFLITGGLDILGKVVPLDFAYNRETNGPDSTLIVTFQGRNDMQRNMRNETYENIEVKRSSILLQLMTPKLMTPN